MKIFEYALHWLDTLRGCADHIVGGIPKKTEDFVPAPKPPPFFTRRRGGADGVSVRFPISDYVLSYPQLCKKYTKAVLDFRQRTPMDKRIDAKMLYVWKDGSIQLTEEEA